MRKEKQSIGIDRFNKVMDGLLAVPHRSTESTARSISFFDSFRHGRNLQGFFA
jgi:hypothetical protein